ncbi:MAG: hypothetical protein ACE5H0_04535, partial [Bacteroidota bacterium]
MKPKFLSFFSIFAVGLLLSGNLSAKEDPEGKSPAKGRLPHASQLVIGDFGPLNINNWVYWLESQGRSANQPYTDDSGGFFPKGTAAVIFRDGFIFGGKLEVAETGLPPTTQEIRVGGQTYNQGMVPGAVIGGVPEDRDAPGVRLYRIRRDYTDPGTDLRPDAAVYFNKASSAVTDADIAQLKDIYDKDWKEWPVAKGAPFVDRDGDGVFTRPPAGKLPGELIAEGLDEPGIAGADPSAPADQVMWIVVNDFSIAASQAMYGSLPTGIELQETIWGYKRVGPLGDILFKKFRFINQGIFRSDSFFVSQWSDPDLGDYSEDFVGADTALSMGFVWNSNSVDREFLKFGIAPPAAGYDFFQGPIVASPGDTAIFDLKPLPGFRNLLMSSFNFFSAGSPITDPTQEDYTKGTLKWWKMLRGFVADEPPAADRRFIDNEGNVTVFALA